VIALCVAACSKEMIQLDVQLVTGLVAGPEFASVETIVVAPGSTNTAVLDQASATARIGNDFAHGRRVASFSLSPGEREVRVRLRRPSGLLLIERRVRLTLSTNFVLRVHITRDCVDVECPGAGAAELTTCHYGRCVDPRCTSASPEFCQGVFFCHSATDCPSVDACAEAVCDEGVCIPSVRASSCASTEWCNPDLGEGCTPLVTDDPNHVECGTLCSIGVACRVGYWNCAPDRAPHCTGLFALPAGTRCGEQLTCDDVGNCLAALDAGFDLGASDDSGVLPDMSMDDAGLEPPGDAGTDAGTDAGIDFGEIVVTPTSGLVTSETGGTASFTVSLSRPSLATVSIPVSSSDPTEGTTDMSSVVFMPGDVGPVTVVVTGADDSIVDGAVAFNILLGSTISLDAGFAGLTPSDVSVTNTDDDAAAFVVTPTSIVAGEMLAPGTFTVALGIEPGAAVTIPLSTTPAGEVTTSPISLTFTSANWNVPQTVSVSGIDDGSVDGPRPFTVVTGLAISPGTPFDGADPADVGGVNVDDEFVVTTASVSSTGTRSNAHLNGVLYGPWLSISNDGRYLGFSSGATNLVPGDVNGVTDGFVHDRVLHTTERVSEGTDNSPTTTEVRAVVVVGDGRYVAFESGGAVGWPGAAMNCDIWLRDRTAMTTTAVGIPRMGDPPSPSGRLSGLSRDARKLTFSVGTLYVRDLMTSTSVLGAVAMGGGIPNNSTHGGPISGFKLLSDDARYVAFHSFADDILPGSVPGRPDLYLRDQVAGTTVRVTTGSAWGVYALQLTPDGRYLLFMAGDGSGLPGDTFSGPDIFLYDRVLATIEIVDYGSSGALVGAQYGSISDDARYVAFGGYDSGVYVRDRQLGITHLLNVSPTGAPTFSGGGAVVISGDGNWIAFVAGDAALLDPGDTNGFTDVFVLPRF
jgi:hypothetical protein